MKKKEYKCPKMTVVYSYDLDTELMYGNTFSGGGHASGIPIVGSMKASDEPPVLELGDEWDYDDSDR